MSFILDALKKSESDRQRQSGPALFEVKVAPPRTGLPTWAVAVAALLLVNLAIVMWMLWRHPAARTADAGMADTSAAAPARATAPGERHRGAAAGRSRHHARPAAGVAAGAGGIPTRRSARAAPNRRQRRKSRRLRARGRSRGRPAPRQPRAARYRRWCTPVPG